MARIALAGYEVIRELGKGGMGEVYLARHIGLDREVAVKRVRLDGSGDQELERRLRREGRALARLDHPNIVRVLDLVEKGAEGYLVMEYVRGMTLDEILAAAEISRGQALRMISEVSAALAYAAAAGVVHRDVKPSNVFLTEAATCKLGDFGVAQMAERGGLATLTGTVLGTTAYMAPEQRSGAADARSDVYSLGVVAYQLLLGGRMPFPAQRTDIGADDPSPSLIRPTEVEPGFPISVERAIVKALDGKPRRRHKDAAHFWDELADSAKGAWPDWQADSKLTSFAVREGSADRTIAIGREGSSPVLPSDRTVLLGPDRLAATSAEDPTIVVGPPGGVGAERRGARADRSQPAGAAARRKGMALWAGGVAVAGMGLASLILVLSHRHDSSPVAPPPTATAPVRPTPTASGLAPIPLSVSAVSVMVTDPPSGAAHCPMATFKFKGQITTNGQSGVLTYRWRQPDGQTSQDAQANVPSGTTSVVETLVFTYQGAAAADGQAVLEVVTPDAVSSAPAPVHYACP